MTLDLLGYTSKGLSQGRDVLEFAKRNQPDLILLDVVLQDMDGLELANQLKQDPETMLIPIIAVTALAHAEARDRVLAAGFDDYISKPYMLEELEAIIGSWLKMT